MSQNRMSQFQPFAYYSHHLQSNHLVLHDSLSVAYPPPPANGDDEDSVETGLYCSSSARSQYYYYTERSAAAAAVKLRDHVDRM